MYTFIIYNACYSVNVCDGKCTEYLCVCFLVCKLQLPNMFVVS